MRGKVWPWLNPGDVHYEIIMNDKSVFYLQDMPPLAYFCNTMVDIEGTVVADPQKKMMYPLLHITRSIWSLGFMLDVILLIVFIVVLPLFYMRWRMVYVPIC